MGLVSVKVKLSRINFLFMKKNQMHSQWFGLITPRPSCAPLYPPCRGSRDPRCELPAEADVGPAYGTGGNLQQPQFLFPFSDDRMLQRKTL